MKNKFQIVFEKQLTLSALFFGFTFATGPIEILIADPIYHYATKFAPELYDTSSILFKNATAAYIMILATIITIIYSKVTKKTLEKGLKAIKVQAGVEIAHFILCIMYFISIVPPLTLIWLLISIYGLFLACTRYNYTGEKQRLVKRESQDTTIQTTSKEDIMDRAIKSEDVEKDIEKINQKEKSFLKAIGITIIGLIAIGTILQSIASAIMDSSIIEFIAVLFLFDLMGAFNQ